MADDNRPLLPVGETEDDVELPDAANKLELPYSPANELRYFFSKGMPLGFAAFFEWGAPPWLTMFMAGQTPDSETLQAALGYGRVFYNCIVFMMLFGFSNYIGTVVPGCVGAARKDRIGGYLQRGALLTSLAMLPFLAMQFAASAILQATSVPADIADQAGTYCRLMVVTASFMIFDLHLTTVAVNLGFARAAAVNSFVTGVAVDVGGNYLFVYRWGWGVHGAALAQMCVKFSRVVVFVFILCIYGEARPLLERGKEALLCRSELRLFATLSVPMIISNFSSWFVFELQIMGLANIANISKPALAAGAIWVQCESTIASIQTGWILSTRIRTLNLLGNRDPGATRSFAILCVLSTAFVAVINIPLLLFPDQVSQAVSNEADVQQWFSDALWVLVLHSQTRVISLNASSLFISMGRSTFGVLLNFVSFYCVAAPISAVVALTDLVTDSVRWKIVACVGTTSIAQSLVSVVAYGYLASMDWRQVSKLIADRANNDRLRSSAEM